MLSLEKVRTALQSSGVRFTPQRMMIIQVLVAQQNHPTVEQVYEIVRESYPSISLATVYNTVSMLARHGLIATIHGGKEGLRLDPNSTVHAHQHCTICGTVIDIPITVQVRLDESAYHEFHPEQLEVALYGRCAKCQAPE